MRGRVRNSGKENSKQISFINILCVLILRGAWKVRCRIRTLYLPKFLTVQVSTASRPAGYVTFDMDPWNSGSGSSPWFKSDVIIYRTT